MLYVQYLISFVVIFVFTLLTLQALYLFIFAFAGRFFRLKTFTQQVNKGSFAVFIPSYKEDAVILDTARAAITIDYPADKVQVIVIADSLQSETLTTLRAMPIRVVEVSFDKSTKAKALNAALGQTSGFYDYALILDADNVCAKDCLHRLNDVLQSGFRVVQGQRVAKNTNTTFALLDAISEGINNHIFRKGHRVLGLSCAIIGSGVALDFVLFKEIMPEITAVGGFDKEMELRLLRRRIGFGYAENALIYDEKTAKQSTFENQRRRWLSAQVHYMRTYVGDGFRQLFKGNIDFFDKVVQTLLLPRILMLGLTLLAVLVSFIPGFPLPPVYWLFLLAVTYLAVFLSIPAQYFNRQLLNAIGGLPMAFASMFMLLFRLKGANKTFIHTPHGEVKPDQVTH